MPKTGTLDSRTVKIVRQIYNEILNKNRDLKAVVDAQSKGKLGKKRVQARRKAIKRLVKTNDLFKQAVLEKFRNL
jgi:hypothetical protein